MTLLTGYLWQFHRECHGTAATEAQGCNAPSGPTVFHGVDELYQDSCSAGPDGVAQSDCSAVHVDACLVESQFANYGQGLHAESFVQFEEIHRVERPAGLRDDFTHGIDGRK